MPRKKKETLSANLVDIIINAMMDKKAKKPVIIHFTQLMSSICDHFIICHGTSRIQVQAIADGVITEVKKQSGIIPWHREGFENAEWILIDYNDIIVHIFQETRRNFFNLEQLWADAEIVQINSPE